MRINTKYEIGQHIWVVYENLGEISVYDDFIDSTIVSDTGLEYYTKGTCVEHTENELVLYDDKEALVDKIYSLMNEIRIKEREEK